MLPFKRRLNKENDILAVIRKGRMLSGRIMTVRSLPSPFHESRFGFLVSKKISNRANQRNLVKRRLRHAVLQHLSQAKSGFDFLFTARPKILGSSYKEIEVEVYELLSRAGVILKD